MTGSGQAPQSRFKSEIASLPLVARNDMVAQFDASGAFETCRVRRGKILHLRDHLERLGASLKTVGIASWDPEAARQGLVKEARGIQDGFVRILVRRWGRPRWVVHRHSGVPYSRRQLERGVSVRTVPTRWPAGESGWAQAKLSERLPAILGRSEAPEVAEVLRLGPHGHVTEGTVSNLFFVAGGRLVTAPHALGVLEGVTRAHVIRAARRLGIPVLETPFTRHELFNAEEAFLTNVLMGILPVREADGRRIGRRAPGPVTRKLRRALSRT